MLYTMKQACELTGMTYQGLKFYCNEGLVPNVKRAENNHRMFDDRDIAWIKSLLCLRDCGMGIKDMKEYIRLCLMGAGSIPERKVILEARKAEILSQIRALEENIKYIDAKQEFYDDVLAGKKEYFSNILPCSCSVEA
ncbi:MAG: MerR family transcriptional regulator [Synergistaceae bacterium]|nr:MerR family transcriptional regulator [Synergistaceae bacterium]